MVGDEYVPLVVVVAVEEAVDGRTAAAVVDTGEFDFLV